jgi:hypothetical protein
MLTPSSSAVVQPVGCARLAHLLMWYAMRFADLPPGPCPDPGLTEGEVTVELMAAGLLLSGPAGERAILTPDGWRLVGQAMMTARG